MERKRMRNSSSRRSTHVWASEEEYEVADILLDFPHLSYKPTPGIASLLSSSSWGSKKRRSAIDDDDDDKDVVVVVNNKSTTTTPLSVALSPSQSHHQNLPKPRRKSVSTNKTKEELLKKVEELTQCKDTLTKAVGVVKAYHNKVSTTNSILKAMKQHELKKCFIEEGKTKAVTTSLKNAETEAASVLPSQQPMSFMYQTPQSCQVFPSEANCSFGYAGGLPISRAMDPSSWPHSFELEGSIGVDHANKYLQAAEARKRRVNKIKFGRN